MFNTRYYLMTQVALFYRATLLDFSERTALVSKQLHQDQEDRRFSVENVSLASELRGDFLHFSNYWHFQELANKDEENEHFSLQCQQYRIEPMKNEIEEEIEKLNASLHTYHQFRNTEAVNRLAVLSLMLGAGAVTTGFFGMNFGRDFARLFFEPVGAWAPLHYGAILLVALMAFGAIGFGFYVVIRNWRDYRGSLGVGSPRETPPRSGPTASSR
jgi:Mg2+ and Co2+ transporter CorA